MVPGPYANHKSNLYFIYECSNTISTDVLILMSGSFQEGSEKRILRSCLQDVQIKVKLMRVKHL